MATQGGRKLDPLNYVKVETICQACYGTGQRPPDLAAFGPPRLGLFDTNDCYNCHGIGRVEGVVTLEEFARVITPAIMRHIAAAQRMHGGYSEGTFRQRQKLLTESGDNTHDGAETTPGTGESFT